MRAHARDGVDTTTTITEDDGREDNWMMVERITEDDGRENNRGRW